MSVNEIIKNLIEAAITRQDSTQAVLMLTCSEPVDALMQKITMDLPAHDIEIVVPHAEQDAKAKRASKIKRDRHIDYTRGNVYQRSRYEECCRGSHNDYRNDEKKYPVFLDMDGGATMDPRWGWTPTIDEMYQLLWKRFDDAKDAREMFIHRLDETNRKIRKGSTAVEDLREVSLNIQNPNLVITGDTRDDLAYRIKRAIYESNGMLESERSYCKELDQNIAGKSQEIDDIYEAIKILRDGHEGTTIEEIILADTKSVSYIAHRPIRYEEKVTA